MRGRKHGDYKLSMRGRKHGDNRCGSIVNMSTWGQQAMFQSMTHLYQRQIGPSNERGSVAREMGSIPSPPCIWDYNSYIGGVDFADRIVKYYNCARCSRRWNRRVIFHLLELLIQNAYVIDSFYNDHRSMTNVLMLKHQSFRDEIADQLVDIITGNTGFTARERFKVESFLVVIDKLTPMSSRMDAYMPK